MPLIEILENAKPEKLKDLIEYGFFRKFGARETDTFFLRLQFRSITGAAGIAPTKSISAICFTEIEDNAGPSYMQVTPCSFPPDEKVEAVRITSVTLRPNTR